MLLGDCSNVSSALWRRNPYHEARNLQRVLCQSSLFSGLLGQERCDISYTPIARKMLNRLSDINRLLREHYSH